MSGIAFILTGCDFSAKNLGKVTFLEDADLTGLTISGLDSVSGITSQYSIGYIPINTSQRGITWSIISGGEYATIDTSTGLLTVLSGASASAVTIKATSTVDNSIVATKNITVTYVATPILLTGLTINGNSSVNGTTSQYSIAYTPTDTTQQGVSWSITSGSQYATIDANTGLLTLLSGASANSVTIKVTSTINNTIVATKNITVTYVATPILLTGLSITGSDTVSGITSQYSVGYTPSNTTQQGVTWSIISGSQYATIDTSTGLLTILSGANANAVTIKAISTVDNTIMATKSITVTYVTVPVLLTGLTINGSSSVNSITSQYTVGYTPTDTTQQGVTWSIISGEAYANINSNTGLLTVLSSASAAAVTIKATSTINNTIYITKNITVTYSIPSLAMAGNVGYVPLPLCDSNFTAFLKVTGGAPHATDSKTISLISCSLLGYLQAVDTFNIGIVYASSSDVVRLSSYANGSVVSDGTGNANTVYSPATLLSDKVILNSDSASINGVSKIASAYSIPHKNHSGYLFINIGKDGVSPTDTPLNYATNSALKAAVIGGNIVPNIKSTPFNIINLIVFKNIKYTTEEDIIANRNSADIDIKFNNGIAYNAGTSGELVCSTLA